VMLRKHCIDYECYILSHCELNIVNTIGLSYVTTLTPLSQFTKITGRLAWIYSKKDKHVTFKCVQGTLPQRHYQENLKPTVSVIFKLLADLTNIVFEIVSLTITGDKIYFKEG